MPLEKSYAVPTNELTLTDIKAYKSAAQEAGITRALSLGLAGTRDELVVREALPLIDMGAAAVNGYGTEYYITDAITAVGWALVFNTVAGAVVAPTLGATKVAVFYKVADADGDPAATAVRFQVGAGGVTTKAVFFFQLGLDNKLESDLYFSKPIVYDPQDVLFIQFYSRAAAHAAEELSFGCYVIERQGSTVS